MVDYWDWGERRFQPLPLSTAGNWFRCGQEYQDWFRLGTGVDGYKFRKALTLIHSGTPLSNSEANLYHADDKSEKGLYGLGWDITYPRPSMVRCHLGRDHTDHKSNKAFCTLELETSDGAPIEISTLKKKSIAIFLIVLLAFCCSVMSSYITSRLEMELIPTTPVSSLGSWVSKPEVQHQTGLAYTSASNGTSILDLPVHFPKDRTTIFCNTFHSMVRYL